MEEIWNYLKEKEFLSSLPIVSRKDKILFRQRVFIKHTYSIKERKKSYPEREDRINNQLYIYWKKETNN